MWICGECNRRVPWRLLECRCGGRRAQAAGTIGDESAGEVGRPLWPWLKIVCMVLGAGVVWFGLYRVVTRPAPAVKLTVEDVPLHVEGASTATAPPPYRS